jgi:dTDP-4-dehydrorhamnose reductase
MKIIILGACGGLGTQLVKTFAAEETLGWDKPEADFFALTDLDRQLAAARPDLVINAVAYNAVDKCASDLAEAAVAEKLNVALPTFLASWCGDHGTKLIHYSTDYVFSGTAEQPEFTEEATPNPINFYGETKARGEAAIIEKGQSGLSYYLIRLSKLFGPKGSSPFTKASFFELMLNLSQTNPELKVVDEEVSCFTYSPDLAVATKQLLADEAAKGIYHLANSGAATWYQAVEELKRLAGFTAAVRPISGSELSRAARRPSYSILRNTKRPPQRDYRAALEEYLTSLKINS